MKQQCLEHFHVVRKHLVVAVKLRETGGLVDCDAEAIGRHLREHEQGMVPPKYHSQLGQRFFVFLLAVPGDFFDRQPSLIVAQALEGIGQHVKGGSQGLVPSPSLRLPASVLLLGGLLRQFVLSLRFLPFPHLNAPILEGRVIKHQFAVVERRLAKSHSMSWAWLIAPP